MRKAFLFAFMGLLPMGCAGVSYASDYPERMGKIHMDAWINLPAPGSLVAVKSGNELLIMSGNGRYIVRGAVYDMWNGGRRIRTLSQAQASAKHIRFDQVNLNVDELATIHVGDRHGKRVVIFIDPESSKSRALVKRLDAIRGYDFQVVLLAVMGKQSATKAKGLMCLAEKNMAKARQVLLSGNIAFIPDGDCGKEKLLKSLVTAMMFGVDKLPFIVAPNGEYLIGNPPDLKKWLEENSQ